MRERNSDAMSVNVLRLGEGGDFTTELSYEAHTSNLRKTVIRSTEPPLLPSRCYQLPFCPSELLSCQVCTELLPCPRALACTLFCFFSGGRCDEKNKCECKCVSILAVSFVFTILFFLLCVFHFH